MNSPFSGKFEAVTSLFKSKKQILEERAAKEKAWAAEPIKSIQDLENFYYEFGDKEWSEDNRLDGNTAPSRKYEDLLSVDELEDDNYWQGVSGHMEDVVAGDDETGALDDWGLNEIMGGGKTQRKIDAKYEELGDYVKTIENENPHTPKDKLSKKDLERQAKIDARFKPTNLPIEKVAVKDEVKVVLEKKDKPMSEFDKFKLMKEALAYNILVANNPDIEKLRPKRGDELLSTDEIVATMKAFRAKEEKGEEEISTREREFFNHCQVWIGVVQKIEGYKGSGPKDTQGRTLSEQEREVLQKEYFDLKTGNPKKFAQLSARLNLENVGTKKVASGEWKKREFTWHEEQHKGKTQWFYQIGNIRYVTRQSPGSIANNGEPADFFYTIIDGFSSAKGDLVIIDLKLPKVEKKQYA